MNVKEALRWTLILGFAAVGLGALWSTSSVERGFANLLFLPFIAGLPWLISYLAFRREYRKLVVIAASIAAATVFLTIILLPAKLRLHDLFFEHKENVPWLFIIALPAALFFYYLPFRLAGWTFRSMLSFADRHFFAVPAQPHGDAVV